jgi:hypothetical protein
MSDTDECYDFTTWLTRSQVVHTLGVSSAWVSMLCAKGQISCMATPLGRLYSRPDVERLADERRRASPE